MRWMKVWDLPVRLFHWAIVLLILFAWLTQEFNFMDWHVRIGYTILTLLLFRVIWGLIGSDTARFSRFLRSPAAALRHLARIHQPEADREIGHNAAGGWMVLVMLALIGVQAGTGLFANDDANTEGPLMHLVDKDQSNWLSHIHSLNFKLIEAVIVLHLLAIVIYTTMKRHDLVRPMVTGSKLLPIALRQPKLASPALAAVSLLVSVAIVALLVRL